MRQIDKAAAGQGSREAQAVVVNYGDNRVTVKQRARGLLWGRWLLWAFVKWRTDGEIDKSRKNWLGGMLAGGELAK